MEKNVRRNKKQYLVIEILLIIAIILSLFVYIKSSIKLIDKKNNYKKLITAYKEKEEEAISIDEEINKLNEQINTYKSIDDEIKKIQDEYFKNIKQLEDDILNGKTDKKIAYMTFDDGPYLNTYNVLNILDESNVKATFFTTDVNGEHCYEDYDENCYKLYKEYIKKGHTIANHTYTHGIFRGLYNSPESFMDAVIKQENHVKELTGGYITNIVRFPGGSATAGKYKSDIIELLRQRGYGWVDWSAHDGDGGNLYSIDVAWDTLKKSINEKIEVILFHDYSKVTTSILPDVIKYLQNNGYTILPLFYESNMINK